MNQIIVLAEHTNGAVTPAVVAPLALAAELGSPAAVLTVAPGTDPAPLVSQLAGLGAARVYVAESAPDVLVSPQVDALQAVLAQSEAAAVLLPATLDAREAGARLAVRTNGGFIPDA